MTEFYEPSGSAAADDLTTLLLTIARALADEADAVRVELIAAQDSRVLRLHVAPADIGKLIGKQGRTARSLRTILSAASMKLQVRYALDIVEAGRAPSAAPPHTPHTPTES